MSVRRPFGGSSEDNCAVTHRGKRLLLRLVTILHSLPSNAARHWFPGGGGPGGVRAFWGEQRAIGDLILKRFAIDIYFC